MAKTPRLVPVKDASEIKMGELYLIRFSKSAPLRVARYGDYGGLGICLWFLVERYSLSPAAVFLNEYEILWIEDAEDAN